MRVSGILWKLFGNQDLLCPTQFDLVLDHYRLTEHCCLQLDRLWPHQAMSPLPIPSSALESIPIFYLTYKNENNLAILAHVVVFSNNRGKEASAWDSYFSQRRWHLFQGILTCVGLWKVLKYMWYLTICSSDTCCHYSFLAGWFMVSVCRVLAAHWMCLRFTAKLMPLEGTEVYDTEYL